MEDILSQPGEDRPGREGARVAIGQTKAGRYLRIIYVPDPEPDSVFVIHHMSCLERRYLLIKNEENVEKNEENQVPPRMG